MKNEKIILASLSSDLKRVAMSLYRNSPSVAQRFFREALDRKNEVKNLPLPSYLQKILEKMATDLADIHNPRVAEDALMYSTLIQNYVLSRSH